MSVAEITNMTSAEKKEALITDNLSLPNFRSSPASRTIMISAINSVMNAARDKNITILDNYDGDEMKVKADSEKTGWVLNNFFSNAIKYAPQDSTIRANVRKQRNELEFSVTDQGPGIPVEYLSKVFERFFKVPGSKVGGTGLGLAISKEFIEAQGGRIWVKSEPGSGSSFGFSLPLANDTI